MRILPYLNLSTLSSLGGAALGKPQWGEWSKMGHKGKQIQALCCPAGHQFTNRHSQVGVQSQRTFSRQAVQTPGLGTAVRIIFPCHLPSMGHRWLLGESSPWHSNGFTWLLQQLLGAPGPRPSGGRSQSYEGLNLWGCREPGKQGNRNSHLWSLGLKWLRA